MKRLYSPAALVLAAVVTLMAAVPAGAQWTAFGGARLGMSVQKQLQGDLLDAATTRVQDWSGGEHHTVDHEQLWVAHQDAISASAWIPAGKSWSGQLAAAYSWGDARAMSSERSYEATSPDMASEWMVQLFGEASRWRADASIGWLMPLMLPRDTRVELVGGMSMNWWRLEMPGEPEFNSGPWGPDITQRLHVLRHTAIGTAATIRMAFPVAGPVLLTAHASTGGDFTDRGAVRNSLRALGPRFGGESAVHSGRWRPEHEFGVGLSITWRGADPRAGTLEPRNRPR